VDITALVADMRSRGGELPGIEVKSAAGGLPDSITETMSAFANLPGGGLLVLGLDEAKGFRPTGLKDAVGLAAGVASRARQALEPAVHVEVDVDTFEGADVVLARVRELPASAKPCFVRRSGQAYLRFADGDYTLSQVEIEGFLSNRSRPRYDEAAVDGAVAADLEKDRVEDFLSTARSADQRFARITADDELLRRTGVLALSGGPTVAGLIALGIYPQQFLPHYAIRAASLPDTSDPSIRALDQATFTGPIAAMVEEAVAWTARNSRRRLITDETTGNVREYQDPPGVAVRELVSNALVHRDLAEWSTSRAIECRLSPTAFRLTNPGGLYGVSADRLGVHPLTSARNRRLVDICKFIRTADGNVVEALASGIPTALAALREAGLPDLDFYDQGITFTVAIRRTENVSVDRLTERTSNRDDPARLLGLLGTPKTLAELAQTLGVTDNAVRKRLDRLRAAGLVTRLGGRGQRTTYTRATEPDD
jgi:ATP-dependent DNA helicase RecG